MKKDFLSAFLGNAQRARVLRVFIFNEADVCSLEDVAKRAGVNARIAKREIDALVKVGIVKKGSLPGIPVVMKNGKKKKVKPRAAWYLHLGFPYLRPLSQFVREISPLKYESVLMSLRKAGKLSAVILSGSFLGDLSRPADVIVVADILNDKKLETAIRHLEPMFGRELRYAGFSTAEFRYRLTIQDRLIRDTLDFPHLVILDRARMLQ